MKNTVLLTCLLFMFVSNAFSVTNLKDMPENKRTKIIKKIAYEAVMKYGKEVYREYGTPRIDSFTIKIGKNTGRLAYYITYQYDKTKERMMNPDYAAIVYIWADTHKAYAIALGNNNDIDIENNGVSVFGLRSQQKALAQGYNYDWQKKFKNLGAEQLKTLFAPFMTDTVCSPLVADNNAQLEKQMAKFKRRAAEVEAGIITKCQESPAEYLKSYGFQKANTTPENCRFEVFPLYYPTYNVLNNLDDAKLKLGRYFTLDTSWFVIFIVNKGTLVRKVMANCRTYGNEGYSPSDSAKYTILTAQQRKMFCITRSFLGLKSGPSIDYLGYVENGKVMVFDGDYGTYFDTSYHYYFFTNTLAIKTLEDVTYTKDNNLLLAHLESGYISLVHYGKLKPLPGIVPRH